MQIDWVGVLSEAQIFNHVLLVIITNAAGQQLWATELNYIFCKQPFGCAIEIQAKGVFTTTYLLRRCERCAPLLSLTRVLFICGSCDDNR